MGPHTPENNRAAVCHFLLFLAVVSLNPILSPDVDPDHHPNKLRWPSLTFPKYFSLIRL